MILLDTHVLIWFRQGSPQLGRGSRRTIDTAIQRGTLAVSAISFYEAAMLAARNRIKLGIDVATWRESTLVGGAQECAIDGAIAIRAAECAGALRDPFDCLILATADIGGHELVTADDAILAWPGRLKRHDARR